MDRIANVEGVDDKSVPRTAGQCETLRGGCRRFWLVIILALMGSITASTGWYALESRALAASDVVLRSRVDRIDERVKATAKDIGKIEAHLLRMDGKLDKLMLSAHPGGD